MKTSTKMLTVLSLVVFVLLAAMVFSSHQKWIASDFDQAIQQNAERMLQEGRQIFRYDTFGDEVFWGDALQLHRAIAGDSLGGTGSGLSPIQALDLGLKVDVDALPAEVVEAIQLQQIDLNSARTTLTLLKVNSVVGVTGFFSGDSLTSIGIQCALCHATVDNSLAPGIGKRLDGWPNRDLNVGAIIAFAPDLSPLTNLLGVDEATVKAVLQSWGPGKFDAELVLDGKAVRDDSASAATLIPPAFGLAGINLHTWTGWGSVTHWNAFVANLEMHGQGTFYDPRLNDASRFPIAAREGFGNVRSENDQITSKLAALHFYQLAMPAPKPPAGSFDPSAAAAGEALFNGKARCATCHVPPLFSEPGWNMHTPEEIGIDDFQANRSPDRHYRTAPLKGLWARSTGGFYHDGRFADLNEVVEHYDNFMNLGLSEQEQNNLVEYLKSLGDADVVVAVEERNDSQLPRSFGLKQNYPNPFNPSTTITYELPKAGQVKVEIFAANGQVVRKLVEKYQAAGQHAVTWDGLNDAGRAVASGAYFYRLQVGEAVIASKKMVLMK